MKNWTLYALNVEKYHSTDGFAKALGVSRVTVSNCINFKRRMRKQHEDRAMELLGIPEDERNEYFSL